MTRHLMPFRSSVLIALAILFSLTLPSSAEIPQVISYQGKVTDSGGTPVADGNYTMRFRIYNAASGGTLRWDSSNRTIAVSDGVFNVLLGESPQPAITLPFTEDYWLLVTFAGVNQSPRQRLSSAGYSYMASGVVLGTEVIGSVTAGAYAAIKGTNTAGSGTAYGLYGQCYSTGGSGVYGKSVASSGYTYGVYGYSASTSGSGVYGHAISTSGQAFGINGRSASSSGRGVFGYATSQTGTTYGVYGQTLSTAGRGVYGYCAASSGMTYGIYGSSNSTSGRGVYGEAPMRGVYGKATYTGGPPSAPKGVYGESVSPSGMGVYGTSPSVGVYGITLSTDGRGVKGWADENSLSSTGIGVEGWTEARDGKGVFGWAVNSTGESVGVEGWTGGDEGRAVRGWATSGTGTTYGVYGKVISTSGYGVYYSGGLAGTGAKSCVVKTSQGPTLMYCQESTESWFEDVGGSRLVNGEAHIELDPLFLETVTIDNANPMRVFVQLHDENSKGVAVKKGPTGFDVIELGSGQSNGTFDYRVMAKRKGFEEKRLDYCKAAETDSYLYPELREKELRELEDKKTRMEEERHRMEEERAQTAEMIEATRE